MRTIKLILILVLMMVLTACGGGGGGGGTVVGATPDNTAPTVETFYHDPATDGDVSSATIQTNGIRVIFDEEMDGATIGTASFFVEAWVAGGAAVSSTVNYEIATRTAKFIPDTALFAAWDYVVTITTAVTDLAGNNLAADYVVTITTANPTP